MDKFHKDEYRKRILFLLRNNKEDIAKNIIRKVAKDEFVAL
jgi:hypothetical protein